jgi:hypothetical protein
MTVVQTAFSTAMTAIGVLCFILCVTFAFYAIYAPETLETAVPQITDAIAAAAQNAQALIKNLINKIV